MRRWFYLHVFLRIRYFLVGDILAELVAMRAQLQALEDVKNTSHKIESALLTLAAHADDVKKPQSSPSSLQRPSA
jgi:hypothetical protein